MPQIAIVFGAGICGYRESAQPDRECMFSLNRALSFDPAHNNSRSTIAFPGYSNNYNVHYGEMMNDWLRRHDMKVPQLKREDYATDFSTYGECMAFWKYVCRVYGANDLLHVYAVVRWLHSYRAVYILRRTCPVELRRQVKIHRIPAPMRELTLPLHEILSWGKLLVKTRPRPYEP